MSADRPAVLTATEAQALYLFMESMQRAQTIRGFGQVCIECSQHVENQGHYIGCQVETWVQRFKDWRP